MWLHIQRSFYKISRNAKSQICAKSINLCRTSFQSIMNVQQLCQPWSRNCNQTRNITKLTTFNVVDNSKLGQKTRRYKKPYLIGFYRKRKTADIGDIIKVAIQGKTSKALVVATRKPKSQAIPRYDNNNIVLLDDNNAPLGTRIKGPIPAILRKQRAKFSKAIALASRFV